MVGFADAFSAENIGNLMNDPRMLLGLQMLQQGGYQPGNPGLGARLGQAGVGAMQQMQTQQHSQALQQYRQQMIAQQQQQMAMQQAQAQAKQEALQRQQQAFQNPDVQAQLSPLARLLGAQGLDPETVLRAQCAAQLQQQAAQFDQRQAHQGGGGQPSRPRMPTQRQVLDQPLGDGMMQRHVLNPETNQYEPYGKPFPQYSPGRKAKAADPLEAVEQHILGNPPAAGPDASSLPGNAPLASYSSQPQSPVGVMPMHAAGSLPGANKPGTRKPGQPKIAAPMTKADYDALPSGAQYIDPVSGKTATKR